MKPLKAELTRDTETFGKMDPVCEIVLGEQKLRTATAEDMGKKPVWKDVLEFHRSKEESIKVIINEVDTIKDDLVGEGEWKIPVKPGKYNETVRIFFENKDVGFVQLEIDYTQ